MKGVRTRGKPRIADVNASVAASNISIKLSFMIANIERGRTSARDVTDVLKWLPKSRTQFNKWAASSLPPGLNAPRFTANAPATLRKDAALRASVDAAIAARLRLAQTAEGKTNTPPKLEKMASLKREIRLLKAMKEIAERELINYRLRAEQLESDLQALRAEGESKSREFAAALAKARQKSAGAGVEKVESKVARLTK